jgi:hypothetical protein
VDLGERATREAAVQERVHPGESGRERPSPVLSPQRGGVGLEAAGPEEVLEGTLALGRGRCGRFDGERGGAHWFRFFFAPMIGRRAAPVNPEDLVVEGAVDTIPRLSRPLAKKAWIFAPLRAIGWWRSTPRRRRS